MLIVSRQLTLQGEPSGFFSGAIADMRIWSMSCQQVVRALPRDGSRRRARLAAHAPREGAGAPVSVDRANLPNPL